MVEIRWTHSAKIDLKEIFAFIATDSKRYASYHIRQIRKRIEILKQNPYSGRIVKEYNEESYTRISIWKL